MEYWRKRRVKAQVRRERGLVIAALRSGDDVPGELAAIPIVVEAEGDPRYVHYPAGEEDVRAVLRALPPGTTDGLQRIVLKLGKQYIADFLSGQTGTSLLWVGRPAADGSVADALAQELAKTQSEMARNRAPQPLSAGRRDAADG